MNHDDKRLVTRVLIATAAAIILCLMLRAALSSAVAHADSGNFGPGPAPGLCTYPFTCTVGEAGGIVASYWYDEVDPVELNGSHRHCHYVIVGTEGNVQIGFQMMITASVGAEGPVGGGGGACYYQCPDGQLAQTPNPPGGWKDAIRPTKCQPIGRDPFAPPPPSQDVPIAPPIAEQGAVPSVPFGQPQPVPQPAMPTPGDAGAPTPPLADQLPSVTDPTCPNPAATVTKSC
jgi:hypothetical protein